MAGLYFEDFHEGQTFEHALSRTVTEMDNVLFSTLTLNPQPLHLDEEFAKTTEFGQRIVNSLFTLGLMIGMTRRRHHPRHHHRQSRHEQGGIPQAGVPWRHDPRPLDRALAARVALAAGGGRGGIRAPGVQPARRDGRHLPARRVHEAPADVKGR